MLALETRLLGWKQEILLLQVQQAAWGSRLDEFPFFCMSYRSDGCVLGVCNIHNGPMLPLRKIELPNIYIYYRGGLKQYYRGSLKQYYYRGVQSLPQKELLSLFSWSGNKSPFCPNGRCYLYNPGAFAIQKDSLGHK